jgi:hypothetical protein
MARRTMVRWRGGDWPVVLTLDDDVFHLTTEAAERLIAELADTLNRRNKRKRAA